MTTVEYASNYEAKRVPVTMRGYCAPGQSQTGYGLKISTDYMIRFFDRSPLRWRRIYASCISNVASYWVIREGKKLFLSDCNLEELICSLREKEILDES